MSELVYLRRRRRVARDRPLRRGPARSSTGAPTSDRRPPFLPGSAAPVPHSSYDSPEGIALFPQASSGWRGRPALIGHREGRGFSSAPRDRGTPGHRRGSGRRDHPRRRRGGHPRDDRDGPQRRGPAPHPLHRHQHGRPGVLRAAAVHRPAARARGGGTARPDRPLVPGAASAAQEDRAGHLVCGRPARAHRPRLLRAVRGRLRVVLEPPGRSGRHTSAAAATTSSTWRRLPATSP